VIDPEDKKLEGEHSKQERAEAGALNIDYPTEEDIRSLIDQLFSKWPKAVKEMRRVETDRGPAVSFLTKGHVGSGMVLFEVTSIVKLSLREYPPAQFPGLAFVAVIAFLNRLRIAMNLAVDNANDISLVEMREVTEAARSVMPNLPKTYEETEDSASLRERLLKRVEGRNKVLIHRPYPTPHADASIPRLMAALAVIRGKKSESEITVGDLANCLGCSDSAVYKTLSRHGITLEEFLHTPAHEWKPSVLDKLDRFLSKIS
jgi:hypothetical protein